MKVFTNRLYEALERQIHQVNCQAITECEKLKYHIISCKKALCILKRFITDYYFHSIDEEVEFFKKVKPQFYSQFIYHMCVYKFFIKKPIGCEKVLEQYISLELDKLKNFYDQNQNFCFYYRTGDTHLDQLYFTRCGCDIYAELDDYQVDDLFSTSHDYRLSKLIAYEQFQQFLIHQKNNVHKVIITDNKSPIVWTGNQSELIELIYALAESGVLNNGNIEIKAAVEFFQNTFQIDLKYYYNKFRDITNRKKERAVFLDKLKLSLDRRIESRFE
ncbi:RteC domain-containing protein [Pedobacter puniceum]|uniref:Tetracycline regulation of excision, RteC n=1 Tax=Pedobacter puniceum TaxID=2666136 RepID=A0A7K0FNY3_9SPHI|nr:RteC domain-containing protein [Pedobacter puniceum]MRX46960.1 tetracycline regulation of excision, RteC [Pedobacter puniceum]